MSPQAELYACLYAREFPAQALLRLRPELHESPCVVLEGEYPTQTVCALNTRARLLGLGHGMAKVEADTFESITVLQRSLRMENATRAVLLECAGSFSPRIEDRTSDDVFVCAVDIAGTESLFGPPLMLAKQLRQRIRALGIVASVTVSANLNTAICAAKGLARSVPIQVIRHGEEAKALSTLPLAILDVTEAQEETFRAWGIRTVGSLAALPQKALISRLGQHGKRLLELARGERPHLFQPIDLPFVLEEEAQLDFPLDDLESLLFGLSTMLEQLILRARSRVYAVASVTITLRLDGGGTHERTVNPRVPTNDKQLWLKLLHLALENHPPQASIICRPSACGDRGNEQSAAWPLLTSTAGAGQTRCNFGANYRNCRGRQRRSSNARRHPTHGRLSYRAIFRSVLRTHINSFHLAALSPHASSCRARER